LEGGGQMSVSWPEEGGYRVKLTLRTRGREVFGWNSLKQNLYYGG